jgi:hypothetical protein
MKEVFFRPLKIQIPPLTIPSDPGCNRCQTKNNQNHYIGPMKPANCLIAPDDAVQGQNSLGNFHDNAYFSTSK